MRDGVVRDGPVWVSLWEAAEAGVRKARAAKPAKEAKAATKAEKAAAAGNFFLKACRVPLKSGGVTSTPTSTATAATATTTATATTGEVVDGKPRRRLIKESDDDEMSVEASSPGATKSEKVDEGR